MMMIVHRVVRSICRREDCQSYSYKQCPDKGEADLHLPRLLPGYQCKQEFKVAGERAHARCPQITSPECRA